MSHDSGVRIEQLFKICVDSNGYQKKETGSQQNVRKPAEIKSNKTSIVTTISTINFIKK